MLVRIKVLVCLIALACSSCLVAQENEFFQRIIPKITHYTREDFEADSQFWTMTEDAEGVFYFGNNDGILVFDGERWQKVTLPNNSAVRSLLTDENNKIHAGGFNEIGLIEKDSEGNYYYKSRNKPLDLESLNLEYFFQVHEFQEAIIYRSFQELIVVRENNVTHIKANLNFIYSGVVNGHFYVQDQNHGIFEFDPKSSSLKKIFETPLNLDNIVAFLPTDELNEVLVLTKPGGVYLANRDTNTLEFIKELFLENEQEEILSAVNFNKTYLLGTLSSGIIELNSGFQLDHKRSTFSKLANSTILFIYPQENQKRIWAMMNSGIDLIEFDSPVSQLFENSSIADIYIHKNILYLATNTGVFYSAFDSDHIEKLSFQKIPNLEGQAWSIQEQNDVILIGHDKGLFRLDQFKPIRIGNTYGIWKVIPINGKTNSFFAAGYSGLYPLTYNAGNWKLEDKISGFDESSRDIVQIGESNSFWICHGYKGVYHLKLNERFDRVFSLEHFTDQNGLQSAFNVNVTLYNKEIIFTTNTGIYTFDKNNSQFIPYTSLNKVLNPKLNTRKLITTDSKVWFVQDDEVGYFDTSNEDITVNKNLFLNLKGNLNRGMESILPLSHDQVLIGATNGLFLYNLYENNPDIRATTQITGMLYQKKQQAFTRLGLMNNQKLTNVVDILRFEFSAPQLTPSSQKEFQFKLEGVDSEWSEWSTNPYKEYTHPIPGDYIFKVRSRNFMGQTASEASLNFTIPHPWYQSKAAYLFYILCIITITFVIIKLVNKKIEKERQKEKLTAQKSKKLLELEIEQLKLEQDKARIKKHKEELEIDNLVKSKELANYTMLLVKKKEIFTETFNALKDFRNSLKTQTARKRLQDVLFNLNQHRMGEEYLNVFDVHFEKVHENFFNHLKEIDPSITKRELRLCAFVKMNLTNKEIAPLLNISTRGVETARYRIRKKLKVNDESFNSYLEGLESISN